MTENLPLIIGAVLVLIVGFAIVAKITKTLMKLAVVAVVLVVLAVLFHDKIPL